MLCRFMCMPFTLMKLIILGLAFSTIILKFLYLQLRSFVRYFHPYGTGTVSEQELHSFSNSPT